MAKRRFLPEIWKARLKHCQLFYKGHYVQIWWQTQTWPQSFSVLHLACLPNCLSSWPMVALCHPKCLAMELQTLLATQSPYSWTFLSWFSSRRWTFLLLFFLFVLYSYFSKLPCFHLSVFKADSSVALTILLWFPLQTFIFSAPPPHFCVRFNSCIKSLNLEVLLMTMVFPLHQKYTLLLITAFL